MTFNAAINQILILFIIMFIGVFAKRSRIITEEVQQSISTLLVKIGLPAMVLASINFESNPAVLPNTIQIFLVTVASYLFVILLGFGSAKLLKLSKEATAVFVSLTVFANVGFMGYPMSRAFFQEVGVFYAAIVNLPFTVLIWTFGILLFNSKEKINYKKLVNIGTISSLIAILLFLFGIKLPDALHTAFDLMGKMTIPLAMLLIGAYIAEINIKDMFSDKRVFLISFLRLLLVPLLTAFVLKAMGLNDVVISMCTIMAAMPAGATNAIFAKAYDAEPLFASVGVFVTTLFSIVTLPLVIYILTEFIL